MPVALAALAAPGLLLTACSPPPTDTRFATRTAAARSDIASDIPSLVRKDSTEIQLLNDPGSRKPGTLIRWDSPTSPAPIPGCCRKDTVPAGPDLTASWWPRTVPAKGLTCSIWATFDEHGHHYAWDTRG